MLSLTLWRALARPPTSESLFRRAYSSAEEPFPWYIGCARWMAGLLIFPVIAFAGTVYSIGWTVGVANTLAQERARRRFDLLGVSPPGAFGVTWAMATGYLYRHRTFRNVNQPGNLIPRVLMTGFILTGLGVLTEPSELITASGFFIRLSVRALTLVAALYAEHVQSVALGAVAGMVAPAYTEDRNNAQFFAFTGYAAAQIITYVGAILIGFAVLPSLLRALALDGTLAYTLLLAARLIVFAALREGCLTLAWRALIARLNAMPADVAAVTGRQA